MNEFQAIGYGLLGFGVGFFILGIFTLGKRQFLVTSNLLIILAVNLIFGIKEFIRFIFQRTRIVGTVAFFLGMTLIFAKLSLPGIISELVGAYWLFGGFLQLFLSLLMKIPCISLLIPQSWRKETLDC